MTGPSETSPSVKTCPQCGRTYGSVDRFCTVDGASLIASGTATVVGTVVAERFLIQEKLGQGGMGEVYLAEHIRMKRKVALKLMRPWMIGDPVAVSRFHREAENASQISHQHVAQVYDFGESSDGLVYLAMEFVEGEPLSSILDREGRLHTVRTVELTRQIADALLAAHLLGILHRDLKPDNVMVGRTRWGTDFVKLVDFGIARAMGRSTQAFTSTGLIVGTPDYMSPEQMSGDALDSRSDLYALALIAFRCLTGQGAYPPGASGESLIARLTQPPLRLTKAVPDVAWPDAVQPAFDRALSPDPTARHADPIQFAGELDHAISQMPLGAAEQEYLLALSKRHATPVRGGAVLEAATPVRSMTPVQTTAVATPPERPSVQTEARRVVPPVPPPPTPITSHPWSGEITPIELPISLPEEPAPEPEQVPAEAPTAPRRRVPALLAATAGVVGVFAVAIVLMNRAGTAPRTSDSTVVTNVQASVSPPVDSATPGPPAAVTGTEAAEDRLARLQRGTVAVWAGTQRGSGVLIEPDGIVLTSAALVGKASTVDVYLDQTTRVHGTVLEVNETQGVAALLVPARRCRACDAIEPDAAIEPAVGDSLLALPSAGRTDGAVVRSAVQSVTAGAAVPTVSPTRLPDGTPVFSAKNGTVVALGVRRRNDRTVLTTTSALRDLRVLARARARTVAANDTLYPTWPARAVPTALLSTETAKSAANIQAYKTAPMEGFVVLAMTPPVIRWRQSLAETASRDTTVDNPFQITPNAATPPPRDPILQWGAWSEIVGERRAVVVLNVSPQRAAFPELPARVVDLQRGDVSSFYLQRDGQRVVPIETGRTEAVGNADAYRAQRKAVFSSGLAAYAPSEFENPSASYEVVIIDGQRAGQTFTVRLPTSMIQQIAADFAWLKR